MVNTALLIQALIILLLITVMGFLCYDFTDDNENYMYLFYDLDDSVEMFSFKAALSYFLLIN